MIYAMILFSVIVAAVAQITLKHGMTQVGVLDLRHPIEDGRRALSNVYVWAGLLIFVLSLVRLGVLSTTTLRKNRRLGYFIVAVVAVLLPGIDPVTTTLEAIPLMVLYEGSIWLSVLMERRSPRIEAASLSEP